MARRVKVASRAIRRGRRLRPESMPPVEPVEQVAAEAPEGDEPLVPEPGDDAANDAELQDEAPRARSGYSRPPAPALHFSQGASLEELAAMATRETELEHDEDEDALDEDAFDEDALDEEDEDELDEEDEDEDALDEEDEDEDADALDEDGLDDEHLPLDDALLGSTLESVASEEPSTRRLAPAVMVEEADDLDNDDSLMRESQATLAPVVEELDEDVAPPSLTPAQRARRSRLRRGVGIAVGAVALLAIGLATKAIVSKPSARSAAEQATPAAALAEAPAAQDPAAAATADEPTPSEAPAEAPAVDSSLDEPTLESDYGKVRKQTLELLNHAKFEQAALWARRLIELEPTEAFGYRCLGSALQDMGRVKEAREVYSQCVQNATKGEIYECSALGGSVKKR